MRFAHCEFTDYNDVVPDHKIPKEWEGRSATTTFRMSEPSTGGAIQKRVRPEFLDPLDFVTSVGRAIAQGDVFEPN